MKNEKVVAHAYKEMVETKAKLDASHELILRLTEKLEKATSALLAGKMREDDLRTELAGEKAPNTNDFYTNGLKVGKRVGFGLGLEAAVEFLKGHMGSSINTGTLINIRNIAQARGEGDVVVNQCRCGASLPHVRGSDYEFCKERKT